MTSDNANSNIKSEKLEKERLLLVEGRSDTQFFKEIFEKLQITNIQILNYKGKEKLHNILKALPTRPGFKNLLAIGITRDADNQKSEDSLKSVQNYLKKARLEYPKKLKEFTDANTKPSMGIFIFPDCEKTGELEDLCYSSISDQDLMECVDQFLKCTENQKNKIKKPAKSKLYAWLSVRNPVDSDSHLGTAVSKGYFNFEHPDFKSLIEFIKNLSEC